MIRTSTKIQDVYVLQPKVFADDRGFFFESYSQKEVRQLLGLKVSFVQDNHSRSSQGVLRGLHYQVTNIQAKLVRVLEGEIFDVVVDIRQGSSSFGQWVGQILSAENKKQLWVPEGFAHGFYVCSDYAQVLYKTTDYYHPDAERCIIWNDSELGIQWPMQGEPILSGKDKAGVPLVNAELFK